MHLAVHVQAALTLLREISAVAAACLMPITDTRLWHIVQLALGEAIARFGLDWTKPPPGAHTAT